MSLPGQLPYADQAVQDAYAALAQRHGFAVQKQLRAEGLLRQANDNVTHATQRLAEVQTVRRTNERARVAVEGTPAEAQFKHVVERADVEIESRQETLNRLVETQQDAKREYDAARDAADEMAARMKAVEAAA